MAAAFHAMPLKHRIRRGLLQTLARLPTPTGKTSGALRILLIRPDHLGDVLLTTPAIHALRAVCPQAEIHALVGPWSAEILARYAEVDVVLTTDFPGFSRQPGHGRRSPYIQAVRSALQLRRIRYDCAIILRPDHWWGAMLAWLAGIPIRTGYDLPDVLPFLTHAVEYRREHVVVQNLRLVEHWTGPLEAADSIYHFPVEPLDEAYIQGYLQEWGLSPNQTFVCIHPGSGTWAKQWDDEKWADVGDSLQEQLNVTVVLTGSIHELALVRRIIQRMKHPPCVMAGDTNVGQLAALFRQAAVVLGPDSGPLHLAAAVGAPTVALFGPADPVEFGPWGPRDRHVMLTSNIGCRPCRVLDWNGDRPEFHPCVRDITAARVLAAAHKLLEQNSKAAPDV